MHREYFHVCVLVLHVASLQGKAIKEKELQLSHLTKCTYDYEVTVYTARGAKCTLSDGYQVHALVRYSLFLFGRWFKFTFVFSEVPTCICRHRNLLMSVLTLL